MKFIKSNFAFYLLVIALVFSDFYLQRGGNLLPKDWIQIPVWFLGIVSISIMFGRVGKVLSYLAMTYVYLFEVIAWALWIAFDMSIGGDCLIVLLNTNKAEVLNFLSGAVNPLAILVLLIVVSGLFLVWMSISKLKALRLSFLSLILGVLMFLPMYYVNVRSQSWRDGLFSVSFLKVFLQTYRCYDSFAGLMRAVNNPDLPEKLSLNCNPSNPPLGVMIIGESATRNHWSLYGYEKRDTTPYLNSISNELCVFTDVVGCWPSTADACRYLLTDTLIEDERKATCTLPEVFKRAGYDCFFYTASPEPVTGCYDVLGACFCACSKKWYLNTKDIEHPKLDELLLPHFMREIQDSEGKPTMLFFQLGGCHYPFDRWYPSSENVFNAQKNDSVCHYDNSVRYDDRIIGEMLKAVKNISNRPVFVVYISDHGETPESNGWRYFPDRDLWELPMFIWFSKSYREQYADIVRDVSFSVNKPLQADQLFWGFTRIGLISGCPQYSAGQDFSLHEFIVRENRLVLKKKVRYTKTGGRNLR